MIYVMSGGGGLNFKVVGGTTQPASPKENTIWVNTDTEITGWTFQAEQPTGAEGLLWIQTAAASVAAFDAVKEDNALMIYPTAAKLYTGGAWTAVEDFIYQAGAWVQLSRELYYQGNEFQDYTGGWSDAGKSYNDSYYSSAAFTKNSDCFSVTSQGTVGASIATSDKVDLSSYKTLFAEVEVSGGAKNESGLAVTESRSYIAGSVAKARTKVSTPFSGVISLDISSLTGWPFYVGVYTLCNFAAGVTMKITRVWAA